MKHSLYTQKVASPKIRLPFSDVKNAVILTFCHGGLLAYSPLTIPPKSDAFLLYIFASLQLYNNTPK